MASCKLITVLFMYAVIIGGAILYIEIHPVEKSAIETYDSISNKLKNGDCDIYCEANWILKNEYNFRDILPMIRHVEPEFKTICYKVCKADGILWSTKLS